MESCGRYIVLVMTFEVATHFLKCISCSITPQTPITNLRVILFKMSSSILLLSLLKTGQCNNLCRM